MKSVLITAGLGLLLMFVEWNMARKKKEGFTATDRSNLFGLFWLTLGACALVAFGVANLT
ncbi:MAG: hypothetical protein ABIH03_03315 [Pseudomonadota bacterium]